MFPIWGDAEIVGEHRATHAIGALEHASGGGRSSRPRTGSSAQLGKVVPPCRAVHLAP